MDFNTITNQLINQPDASQIIKTVGDGAVERIRNGEFAVIELVKGLDSVLTNGDHDIRLRGLELLVYVVISLPNDLLNDKEINVLSEFICLRLVDHKTMEASTLKCLRHFVHCQNKPPGYNKQLLDFFKTKISIRKLDTKIRHQIYDILKKILIERRQISASMDGDLIYSIVHLIEGENNPENLMLCFDIVFYILKNFDNLEPYIEDLFDFLFSYFPVNYTPDETENINIQRSDLVQAIYDCFYSNPLNADILQSSLLEKLDSNLSSTKIESLECLIRCYEVFPLSSIKKYASTLWTAVRMISLKKENLVDGNLLDTSYKALSALSKRLAEDDEQHFTFVSEMYEELAIAFRKPEMDLFEPAAKLLTHAIQPSIVGFNYTLNKILPVSSNALVAGEFRPLPGLSYIFEQLYLNHSGSKLKSDLNELIGKLVLQIIEFVFQNKDCVRLLNALICQQVPLDEPILNEVIEKLWAEFETCSYDLEECLALICINYKRLNIITEDSSSDLQLGSLLKLIRSYDQANAGSTAIALRLSVYLRLLILKLDPCPRDELDKLNQNDLSEFMNTARDIAIKGSTNQRLIGKVAQLHAIILNKLGTDNASAKVMDIFRSDYCQKLVPSNDDEAKISSSVYLPVLGWVYKSLVVRNHQLASPIVNLILNFISSEKVDYKLAVLGTQVFQFVLQDGDTDLFKTSRHYQRFVLYKQKFYVQTTKELKARYEMHSAGLRRNLILCTWAQQVPHLPQAVYKKDADWLFRQLLLVLASFKTSDSANDDLGVQDEQILHLIYGCIESLIQKDLCNELVSFLAGLVDLTLKHAKEARTLRVRRRALACLTNIATCFKDSDLLVLRSIVTDNLRACLSDKKRLVRQAAAEARLRWVLIGQPIGSSM